MLNFFAPCIESHGHEAKLVTMLRDTGENIDWHRVKRDEPGAPLVMAPEMLPKPADQPEWDYHHWVLGMSSWHAYLDEHGHSCLPQDPSYMPTRYENHVGSSEIQSMHESPEIHHMQDQSLEFILADLALGDQWDIAASLAPHQPYPERAHDWEASGSGTQPDLSWFHTPPPATHAAEDTWGTALTMSREAEPEVEITPARVAQEGEVQWNNWHRVFTRENRGRPADRYSNSHYR